MSLTDYNIDTSGSPQDVQRRQALAASLLKHGGDTSPAAGGTLGGWATIAGRALSGALGGYQNNAAATEQQQGQDSYKQQLASALQGGKLDAPTMVSLAGNPWATPSQTQAVTHAADMQAQQARQGVEDQHWAAGYALQKQAAQRAQEEFDNTPDQYKPNPLAGQPGQPDYIDEYAAATPVKPIPVETLSGTRLYDPKTKSYITPGQAAPAAVPSSAPAAPTAVPSSAPASAPASPTSSSGSPPSQPSPAATAPSTDVNAIDPNTGRREAWLATQDPDVQDYIKKVANYEIDPRTSSTRGGHREQILSAVAKYDPNYNQNEFGSRSKAIKDFSTGQQGNAIRSFDVATDHLDTLQKYAQALQNGDIPLINSIRNKWSQETGSSLPTNFEAVAPIVGAEVSKAIIGSNNALADREELRAPLNAARSPQQLLGSIQAYKALMTGQLRGLKKQYEDTTGMQNFNSRLRPSTLAVLGGEESGPAGAPQVGTISKGYRFKGGDPSIPSSWEQVQ